MARLESFRDGFRPGLLYGLLALLTFPTFGHLLAGEQSIAYAHDVFELPRTGVLDDWLANGPTLWNTHLTGGNALFAQQWNTPFGLDVVVAFLVGPFAAYVLNAWAMAALAGLSMHLFLRDSLRLSTVAVLAGAISYTFVFWHSAYGFAAPTVPLLLWLADRMVAADRRRWRSLCAASVGGAVLLYHTQSQVALLVAGLQLVYLLAAAPDRSAVRSRIALWSGTWILALGIYGPVLVTQLVMLPISNRAVWDLQALYDPTPIQAVIDTILRYSQVVLGAPMSGGLGASPEQFGTFFAGAIGLPLLVLGVIGVRRDRRGWFLLALLVAIPLFDLFAVLIAPVQQQLGFLKSFQLDRIGHVFPFVVVANTALGVDLLARTVLAGRPLRLEGRWRWPVVGASVIPLVVALAVAAREVIARRHALIHLATPALGWALMVMALVVGLGCLSIVVVGGVRSGRGASRTSGALLGTVLLLGLVGERAAYAWGERFAAPPGTLGTWAEALGTTPAKTFLRDQPGIDVDRVLSFGGSPNQLAAAGMLQVDGYQSLFPLTYHAFFGALIAPQLATSPTLTTYYEDWGNRAVTFGPNVDPELVALSGARWLYVLGTDVPTVPGIVPRFHDGKTTVYEVPDVLPRAFIVDALDVRADQAGVLAGLSSADLTTLRGTAFVAAGPDADVLGDGLASTATGGPAGSATIASYTPDRVVVDVATTRSGVLILTDVMAPGWVAERDGDDRPDLDRGRDIPGRARGRRDEAGRVQVRADLHVRRVRPGRPGAPGGHHLDGRRAPARQAPIGPRSPSR